MELSKGLLSKIKMLATLPSVHSIETGRNRIFSLVIPNILRCNVFLEDGQGPEKPIIEEVDVEEEVFTFPYPEERWDISDIVNPPIEGIVGKVLNTKSRVDKNLVITKDFSNVFSYLFFNSSLERATRATKPEFVSLTRQPEIATSYIGLLVYSSYTASNPTFSYTSDNLYERLGTPTDILYSKKNVPFYETRFPIPMISKRVYYGGKENDKVYVKPLTQAKSQPYQNVTHEEINVQPVNTHVIDITYDNNVSDSNSRLNLKLDYEAPKLELPLVRTKLQVLDLNIETNENKVAILPLYEQVHKNSSCNINGLAVPITLPKANTVVVPKYDEARVKYKAVKDVINLSVNLGFDDTLLTDRFIERLDMQVIELGLQDIKLPELEVVENRVLIETYANAKNEGRVQGYEVAGESVKLFDNPTVKRGEVRVDLMEEPAFQYNSRSLDFSLDGQPITYEKTRISLDPYSLFSLKGTEAQTTYRDNLEVRNILLPNTEYKPRSNLDNLVRVNYDTRMQSLPGISTNGYNLDFIDSRLQVQLQQVTEDSLMVNSDYEGIASEQCLEGMVEQKKGLTEEKPDENIEAEIYDDNIAQEEVYEKSEIQEEQETETNKSKDSPFSYAAVAAGVVGLGVLAGVGGIVGALLKKSDNEEIAPNKPDEALYKSEEGIIKENCGNTSQCFADTIDWLEERLKNLTLTDQGYESISQCYAEDIKNIQKARDYIRQREIKKPCGRAFYDRFHHVGFTEEQKEKYKLKDYIRNAEIQEVFKLAAAITAGDDIEGEYYIGAIWEDDIRGGELDRVKLRKNSAYAQVDISLREQGYTPLWKIMSYIDTDTGEKRSGLYLETIAELHLESKGLFGDKDEYGTSLMGLILLVNGEEPGKGTLSMHDYDVKSGDKIEVLFKNDLARYDENRQPISNKEIKVDSTNYSEIKKSPEKVLEPALF